jgi:hypothetical protein
MAGLGDFCPKKFAFSKVLTKSKIGKITVLEIYVALTFWLTIVGSLDIFFKVCIAEWIRLLYSKLDTGAQFIILSRTGS